MDALNISHCDAERAVKDGSYKSLPDADLEALRLACINVVGPNLTAVDRIRKTGDLIGEELSSRKEKRRLEESNPVFSPSPNNEMLINPIPNASEYSPWNETKLLKLIADGIEEDSSLEYKSAGALEKDNRKTTEITKDVSSMANSAGGTLIYGISAFQDAARKHLPERIDPISRTKYSKEWLEHTISQIRPRIPGVIIYSVALNSNQDHVAYVVEIPQGTTAHQATSHRYYRRYNFEAVAMLDHEVRDVMSRKSHPKLVIKPQFLEFRNMNNDGSIGALSISIINDSDVFARYVALTLHVPMRFRGKLIHFENEVIDIGKDGYHCLKLTYSNHLGAPLFPKSKITKNFNWWPVNATIRRYPLSEAQSEICHFVVFADSMPKQEGEFTLEDAYSKWPPVADGQQISQS